MSAPVQTLRSIEDRQARATLAFLAPGFLLVLALFVVPVVLVLVYSVLTRGTYGGVVWDFSADSYARIIGLPNEDELRDWDFVYLSIFARTTVTAGITALIALLLGYPAAWFIARQPERRRYALLLLVTVPFFVNALVRIYAWVLILRADGLVNNILLDLGLISAPRQLIYTRGAVILAMVYQYLPFMVLPLFASLEKLDMRLVEASLDLGAGRLATFHRVVLPLTRPGIAAGLVLVFVPAFGNYVAPTLIGGSKELEVGTLMAQAFLSARDWPFGSAVAAVLGAVVLLALVLMVRTERRSATPVVRKA